MQFSYFRSRIQKRQHYYPRGCIQGKLTFINKIISLSTHEIMFTPWTIVIFFILENKQIYRNSIKPSAAEFKVKEIPCVMAVWSYYSKYMATPKEVGGNFPAYPSVKESMNELSYEVARDLALWLAQLAFYPLMKLRPTCPGIALHTVGQALYQLVIKKIPPRYGYRAMWLKEFFI